jgi:hypothetical protein
LNIPVVVGLALNKAASRAVCKTLWGARQLLRLPHLSADHFHAPLRVFGIHGGSVPRNRARGSVFNSLSKDCHKISVREPAFTASRSPAASRRYNSDRERPLARLAFGIVSAIGRTPSDSGAVGSAISVLYSWGCTSVSACSKSFFKSAIARNRGSLELTY